MKDLQLLACLVFSFSVICTMALIQDPHLIVYATPNSALSTSENIPIQDAPAQPISTNEPNSNIHQELLDLSSSVPFQDSAIHSKYLAITKSTFRPSIDLYSYDSIAGTILNNSTVNVKDILVSAALFDKNNNLIDLISGTVDFPTLRPNDDTTFKLNIYSDVKEFVDHYMLIAVGKFSETTEPS